MTIEVREIRRKPRKEKVVRPTPNRKALQMQGFSIWCCFTVLLRFDLEITHLRPRAAIVAAIYIACTPVTGAGAVKITCRYYSILGVKVKHRVAEGRFVAYLYFRVVSISIGGNLEGYLDTVLKIGTIAR